MRSASEGMQPPRVTVTVAVCTRDRASVLAACLRSLDGQLSRNGDVEILVVDNGSTDTTPSMLEQWRNRGPGRRVVREPRVGLSMARNAALASSDRHAVAFLDDDALVPPTWAQAHLQVHRDAVAAGDRIGMVGGPIGLVWPAGRPPWVSDLVASWFSALDLGDETGPFPTEHGPYGTNMSVSREAALAVGGFDPRLGRKGARLLSSEERDLTRRLSAAGWGIHYVPAAAVVQQVLPSRLRRPWVLRRAWAQGISNARFDVIAEPRSRRHRLSLARSSVAASRAAFQDWFRGDRAELDALVVALAHGAAAVEYARLTARRGARG